MIFTDPPYNGNFSSTRNKHNKILNDNIDNEEFNKLISNSFRNIKESLASDNCHVYICCNILKITSVI